MPFEVEPVNWQHGFVHIICAKSISILNVGVECGLILSQKMEEGWVWDVLVLNWMPACIIYHGSGKGCRQEW